MHLFPSLSLVQLHPQFFSFYKLALKKHQCSIYTYYTCINRNLTHTCHGLSFSVVFSTCCQQSLIHISYTELNLNLLNRFCQVFTVIPIKSRVMRQQTIHQFTTLKPAQICCTHYNRFFRMLYMFTCHVTVYLAELWLQLFPYIQYISHQFHQASMFIYVIVQLLPLVWFLSTQLTSI